MIYKIVVSDRDFTVLSEIQHRIGDISWEYLRNGGCGSVNLRMNSRVGQNIVFSPGFNIKIYRKNLTTLIYDLWYQGRIESVLPDVNGANEIISVTGFGYQSQLRDIHISATYTSTEISVIVKSLLDNHIVPNTDITYSAADITATTFTPDSVTFNGNALDAMTTLADITGSREWGVDADRKFFFKQRSSSVGYRFPLNKNVLSISEDDSSRDIVNRVLFVGGGDPPFTETYNDTISQLKWGRRDKFVQNSAITTTSVASQFADSIFTELSDIVRRAKVDILQEVQIEETIPIPLVRMLPKLARYGELRYGEFLYSGYIDYQVNRIHYTIDDSGNLKLSIQLGQLRPSVAEDISQLEYQIDQIRQQNL